ncbi:MAG: RdgB/HAM1 family non-canonical purine NTP pyrophosphatase [Massiliimalia sp.]|jgi:XTP/dITP diphosphohydrolase
MMKIVIATKNQHKLKEFKRILEPLGYEVLSQADAGVDVDVEETGTTFEENSMLKAQAIYHACGLCTIADDSGLSVDALNGEPGVYSARYGGPGLDDEGRCRLLLKNMEQVPILERTARFVSVISLIFSENDKRVYRGEAEGMIGYDMLGKDGFGYDPVFMVNGTDSFATLTGAQKDKISHRGKALEQMQEDLKNNPPV